LARIDVKKLFIEPDSPGTIGAIARASTSKLRNELPNSEMFPTLYEPGA
jgi:hypothetical protein